jgi:hypothetical protein
MKPLTHHIREEPRDVPGRADESHHRTEPLTCPRLALTSQHLVKMLTAPDDSGRVQVR